MASNVESADEIKNGKPDIDNEVNLNNASPNCALCGCSTPAVRCDKCASQIFCLSCDDMYHRHPKRRLHLRKAVDSIWNSHRSPHLRRHTNLPGDPSKIPIPPPRRKRRERYTISGTGLPKSAFEVFSTREPWATRGQNVKSHDMISDSFASDDGSLPPLPKQQRSSVEQKYENSEAITQQNNGINSKSGRTPDSEVSEQVMSEEQKLHDSMQSPSSPSQPLLVDMPDGRTFGPPGQLYSRGSHMSHSAAELRSGPFPSSSPHPFFYPHPHPQFIHPQMHPFPHAIPHVNCPQCLTGSWSNMMSPHVPLYHQPWSSAQSSLSRRQPETAGEGQLRQRQNSLPDAAAAAGYPGPPMPFPPAAFPYVGSPYYPHGYPAAESPLFMDSPRSTDQQRQTLLSPSSTSSRQSHGTDKHDEIDQVAAAQKTSDEVEAEEVEQAEEEEVLQAEEVEEEEEEEVADPDVAEVEYKPPEKPVEPWSCVHCTFINPPGNYICQICCKTSYPSPANETKKQTKKKKKSEQDSAASPGASQKKADDVECTTEESMQVDAEQLTTVDSEKDLNANILISSKEEKSEAERDESADKVEMGVPDTAAATSEPDDVIQKDELERNAGVRESDRKIESGEGGILSPKESDVQEEVAEDTTAAVTSASLLTTETQTVTLTTSTDVQTQKMECMSVASSTDSLFPYFHREMSVQTEIELSIERHSVATDPMISSHSMESLMSGVSAPPYHNRRAGMGRAGNSFSTQSLSAFERGRSRSPIPRPSSSYGEMASFGRGLNSISQEPLPHSWNRSFWGPDPMFYKPYGVRRLGHGLREDYFDGTWGSMDRLNKDLKKREEEKWKTDSIHKPRLHRSLTDLKSDRAADLPYLPEMEFLQTVKDAERHGYTIDDLQVAYLHCDKIDPVRWLDDNWDVMIQNVISLAAKYGEDHEENDVGAISPSEAKDALRIHHGNLWDAVTECIEIRQRKILELTVRGNFTQKQIVEALKNNGGNVELAYADLIRATSRIFKHILSPGLSEESEDIAIQRPSTDETPDPESVKKPLVPSDKLTHAISSTEELLNEEDRKTETESKRSDFLTKLTAIRKAQSERRKAREEKELSFKVEKTPRVGYLEPDLEDNVLDENIISPHEEESVQDTFTHLTTEHFRGELEEPLESPIPADENFELKRSTSKSPPVKESDVKVDILTEAEEKVPPLMPKDEEIPEDYDSHWIDSQGEWIEEFSDEQWEEDGEEGKGEWVTVRTKYRKLEADLDEEAKQLASLWEHEELVDDVFEEEVEVKKNIQEEPVEMDHFATEDKFEDDKKENWVKVDYSVPEHAASKVDSILKQPANVQSSLIEDVDHHDELVVDEQDEKIKDILEPIEMDHFAKEIALETDKENWVKIDYSEPEHDFSKADTVEKQLQKEELAHVKHTELQDDASAAISVSALTDIHDELQPQEDWVTVQTESTVGNDILYEGPIADDKTFDLGVEPAVAKETVVQDSLSDECSEGEWEKVETQEQYPDSLHDNFLTSTDDEAQYLYRVSSEEEYRYESEAIESLSETEIAPETLNLCLAAALEEGTKALPLPPKRQKIDLPSVEPTPLLKQQDTDQSDYFKDKLEKDKLQETVSAPDDSALPQVPVRRRSKVNGIPLKYVEKPVDASQSLPEPDKDKSVEIPSESVDAEASRYFEKLEISPSYPLEEEESVSARTELPFDQRVSDNKQELVKAINFCSRTYNNVPAEDTLDLFALEPEIHSMPSTLQKESDEFYIPATEPFAKEITSLHPAVASEQELYFEEFEQVVELADTDNLILEHVKMDETVVDIPSDVISSQTEYAGALDFQPSSYLPSEENQLTDAYLRESPMLSPADEEEPVPAFSEMEATSAAADYFFGRYNEVVVTRKGKKKPAPQKTKKQLQGSTMAQSVSPSTALPSKDMTKSTPPLKTSSSVEDRVEVSVKPLTEQAEKSTKTSAQVVQPSVFGPPGEIVDKVEEKIRASDSELPTPPTAAPQAESLSFAEDYFFGSYNEVVVQKKPKKKPIPFKSKESLDKILSSSKEHVLQTETKSVFDVHSSTMPFRSRSGSDVPMSTTELRSQSGYGVEEPSAELRNRSGSDVQAFSGELLNQTSVTYTPEESQLRGDNQHKTEIPSPEDVRAAPSQDVSISMKDASQEEQKKLFAGSPPLSAMQENQQDNLSNMQSETSKLVASSISEKSTIDSKIKTVHFQELEPPVIPPPRKVKKTEKSQQVSTLDQTHGQQPSVTQTKPSQNTYAAAEYLFGRYDEITPKRKATPPPKSLQAKKKLPPCTEDFKIKPECEPTTNLPQTLHTSLKESDYESLLSSGPLLHDNTVPDVLDEFEIVSAENVVLTSSTSDLSEDFAKEKNYVLEESNVPVESFQKHVETAYASDKMTYGELYECAAEKFVSDEPIESGSDSQRSSGESMETTLRASDDEETPFRETLDAESIISSTKDDYFKPRTSDSSFVLTDLKIGEEDTAAPTEETVGKHDDAVVQVISDAIEDHKQVTSLNLEGTDVTISDVNFGNVSAVEETGHEVTVGSGDVIIVETSVENLDTDVQCEAVDHDAIKETPSLSTEHKSIYIPNVDESESAIEEPYHGIVDFEEESVSVEASSDTYYFKIDRNKEDDEVKLSCDLPHEENYVSIVSDEFTVSCDAVAEPVGKRDMSSIVTESIDSEYDQSHGEAPGQSSSEIATQLMFDVRTEFPSAPDSSEETILPVDEFVSEDNAVPDVVKTESSECVFSAATSEDDTEGIDTSETEHIFEHGPMFEEGGLISSPLSNFGAASNEDIPGDKEDSDTEQISIKTDECALNFGDTLEESRNMTEDQQSFEYDQQLGQNAFVLKSEARPLQVIQKVEPESLFTDEEENLSVSRIDVQDSVTFTVRKDTGIDQMNVQLDECFPTATSIEELSNKSFLAEEEDTADEISVSLVMRKSSEQSEVNIMSDESLIMTHDNVVEMDEMNQSELTSESDQLPEQSETDIEPDTVFVVTVSKGPSVHHGDKVDQDIPEQADSKFGELADVHSDADEINRSYYKTMELDYLSEEGVISSSQETKIIEQPTVKSPEFLTEEENILDSTSTSAETDEYSLQETTEEITNQESYSSIISHFYEEWIENAYPVKPEFVDWQQDDLESEEERGSYSESSSVPFEKDSLQEFSMNRSSADSYSSIEDSEEENAWEEPAVPEAFVEKDANKKVKLQESISLDYHDSVSELDVDIQEDAVLITSKVDEVRYVHEKAVIQRTPDDTLSVTTQLADVHPVQNVLYGIDVSCQTDEDFFEEDEFFDTSDDSYLHLSRKSNVMEGETSKIEIGIQCHMINGLSEKKHLIKRESCPEVKLQDTVFTESFDLSKIDHSSDELAEKDEGVFVESAQDVEEIQRKSDETLAFEDTLSVAPKISSDDESTSQLSTAEESVYESSEESDSDIFLELSPSEDTQKINKGRDFYYFLHPNEADSDTGFSSGSDTGLAFHDTESSKKRLEEFSHSEVDSKIVTETVKRHEEIQHTSEQFVVGEKVSVYDKDVKQSFEKCAEILNVKQEQAVIEKISRSDYSDKSSALEVEFLEETITSPVAERKYDICPQPSSTEIISISLSQSTKICETKDIHHTTTDVEPPSKTEKLDQPSFSDSVLMTEELLARAITPTSIEKIPFAMEEIKFIEVESQAELQKTVVVSDTTKECWPSPATVEYFLPQAVADEKQSDEEWMEFLSCTESSTTESDEQWMDIDSHIVSEQSSGSVYESVTNAQDSNECFTDVCSSTSALNDYSELSADGDSSLYMLNTDTDECSTKSNSLEDIFQASTEGAYISSPMLTDETVVDSMMTLGALQTDVMKLEDEYDSSKGKMEMSKEEKVTTVADVLSLSDSAGAFSVVHEVLKGSAELQFEESVGDGRKGIFKTLDGIGGEVSSVCDAVDSTLKTPVDVDLEDVFTDVSSFALTTEESDKWADFESDHSEDDLEDDRASLTSQQYFMGKQDSVVTSGSIMETDAKRDISDEIIMSHPDFSGTYIEKEMANVPSITDDVHVGDEQSCNEINLSHASEHSSSAKYNNITETSSELLTADHSSHFLDDESDHSFAELDDDNMLLAAFVTVAEDASEMTKNLKDDKYSETGIYHSDDNIKKKSEIDKETTSTEKDVSESIDALLHVHPSKKETESVFVTDLHSGIDSVDVKKVDTASKSKDTVESLLSEECEEMTEMSSELLTADHSSVFVDIESDHSVDDLEDDSVSFRDSEFKSESKSKETSGAALVAVSSTTEHLDKVIILHSQGLSEDGIDISPLDVSAGFGDVKQTDTGNLKVAIEPLLNEECEEMTEMSSELLTTENSSQFVDIESDHSVDDLEDSSLPFSSSILDEGILSEVPEKMQGSQHPKIRSLEINVAEVKLETEAEESFAVTPIEVIPTELAKAEANKQDSVFCSVSTMELGADVLPPRSLDMKTVIASSNLDEECEEMTEMSSELITTDHSSPFVDAESDHSLLDDLDDDIKPSLPLSFPEIDATMPSEEHLQVISLQTVISKSGSDSQPPTPEKGISRTLSQVTSPKDVSGESAKSIPGYLPTLDTDEHALLPKTEVSGVSDTKTEVTDDLIASQTSLSGECEEMTEVSTDLHTTDRSSLFVDIESDSSLKDLEEDVMIPQPTLLKEKDVFYAPQKLLEETVQLPPCSAATTLQLETVPLLSATENIDSVLKEVSSTYQVAQDDDKKISVDEDIFMAKDTSLQLDESLQKSSESESFPAVVPKSDKSEVLKGHYTKPSVNEEYGENTEVSTDPFTTDHSSPFVDIESDSSVNDLEEDVVPPPSTSIVEEDVCSLNDVEEDVVPPPSTSTVEKDALEKSPEETLETAQLQPSTSVVSTQPEFMPLLTAGEGSLKDGASVYCSDVEEAKKLSPDGDILVVKDTYLQQDSAFQMREEGDSVSVVVVPESEKSELLKPSAADSLHSVHFVDTLSSLAFANLPPSVTFDGNFRFPKSFTMGAAECVSSGQQEEEYVDVSYHLTTTEGTDHWIEAESDISVEDLKEDASTAKGESQLLRESYQCESEVNLTDKDAREGPYFTSLPEVAKSNITEDITVSQDISLISAEQKDDFAVIDSGTISSSDGPTIIAHQSDKESDTTIETPHTVFHHEESVSQVDSSYSLLVVSGVQEKEEVQSTGSYLETRTVTETFKDDDDDLLDKEKSKKHEDNKDNLSDRNKILPFPETSLLKDSSSSSPGPSPVSDDISESVCDAKELPVCSSESQKISVTTDECDDEYTDVSSHLLVTEESDRWSDAGSEHSLGDLEDFMLPSPQQYVKGDVKLDDSIMHSIEASSEHDQERSVEILGSKQSVTLSDYPESMVENMAADAVPTVPKIFSEPLEQDLATGDVKIKGTEVLDLEQKEPADSLSDQNELQALPNKEVPIDQVTKVQEHLENSLHVCASSTAFGTVDEVPPFVKDVSIDFERTDQETTEGAFIIGTSTDALISSDSLTAAESVVVQGMLTDTEREQQETTPHIVPEHFIAEEYDVCAILKSDDSASHVEEYNLPSLLLSQDAEEFRLHESLCTSSLTADESFLEEPEKCPLSEHLPEKVDENIENISPIQETPIKETHVQCLSDDKASEILKEPYLSEDKGNEIFGLKKENLDAVVAADTCTTSQQVLTEFEVKKTEESIVPPGQEDEFSDVPSHLTTEGTDQWTDVESDHSDNDLELESIPVQVVSKMAESVHLVQQVSDSVEKSSAIVSCSTIKEDITDDTSQVSTQLLPDKNDFDSSVSTCERRIAEEFSPGQEKFENGHFGSSPQISEDADAATDWVKTDHETSLDTGRLTSSPEEKLDTETVDSGVHLDYSGSVSSLVQETQSYDSQSKTYILPESNETEFACKSLSEENVTKRMDVSLDIRNELEMDTALVTLPEEIQELEKGHIDESTVSNNQASVRDEFQNLDIIDTAAAVLTTDASLYESCVLQDVHSVVSSDVHAGMTSAETLVSKSETNIVSAEDHDDLYTDVSSKFTTTEELDRWSDAEYGDSVYELDDSISLEQHVAEKIPCFEDVPSKLEQAVMPCTEVDKPVTSDSILPDEAVLHLTEASVSQEVDNRIVLADEVDVSSGFKGEKVSHTDSKEVKCGTEMKDVDVGMIESTFVLLSEESSPSVELSSPFIESTNEILQKTDDTAECVVDYDTGVTKFKEFVGIRESVDNVLESSSSEAYFESISQSEEKSFMSVITSEHEDDYTDVSSSLAMLDESEKALDVDSDVSVKELDNDVVPRTLEKGVSDVFKDDIANQSEYVKAEKISSSTIFAESSLNVEFVVKYPQTEEIQQDFNLVKIDSESDSEMLNFPLQNASISVEDDIYNIVEINAANCVEQLMVSEVPDQVMEEFSVESLGIKQEEASKPEHFLELKESEDDTVDIHLAHDITPDDIIKKERIPECTSQASEPLVSEDYDDISLSSKPFEIAASGKPNELQSEPDYPGKSEVSLPLGQVMEIKSASEEELYSDKLIKTSSTESSDLVASSLHFDEASQMAVKCKTDVPDSSSLAQSEEIATKRRKSLTENISEQTTPPLTGTENEEFTDVSSKLQTTEESGLFEDLESDHSVADLEDESFLLKQEAKVTLVHDAVVHKSDFTEDQVIQLKEDTCSSYQESSAEASFVLDNVVKHVKREDHKEEHFGTEEVSFAPSEKSKLDLSCQHPILFRGTEDTLFETSHEIVEEVQPVAVDSSVSVMAYSDQEDLALTPEYLEEELVDSGEINTEDDLLHCVDYETPYEYVSDEEIDLPEMQIEYVSPYEHLDVGSFEARRSVLSDSLDVSDVEPELLFSYSDKCDYDSDEDIQRAIDFNIRSYEAGDEGEDSQMLTACEDDTYYTEEDLHAIKESAEMDGDHLSDIEQPSLEEECCENWVELTSHEKLLDDILEYEEECEVHVEQATGAFATEKEMLIPPVEESLEEFSVSLKGYDHTATISDNSIPLSSLQKDQSKTLYDTEICETEHFISKDKHFSIDSDIQQATDLSSEVSVTASHKATELCDEITMELKVHKDAVSGKLSASDSEVGTVKMQSDYLKGVCSYEETTKTITVSDKSEQEDVLDTAEYVTEPEESGEQISSDSFAIRKRLTESKRSCSSEKDIEKGEGEIKMTVPGESRDKRESQTVFDVDITPVLAPQTKKLEQFLGMPFGEKGEGERAHRRNSSPSLPPKQSKSEHLSYLERTTSLQASWESKWVSMQELSSKSVASEYFVQENIPALPLKCFKSRHSLSEIGQPEVTDRSVESTLRHSSTELHKYRRSSDSTSADYSLKQQESTGIHSSTDILSHSIIRDPSADENQSIREFHSSDFPMREIQSDAQIIQTSPRSSFCAFADPLQSRKSSSASDSSFDSRKSSEEKMKTMALGKKRLSIEDRMSKLMSEGKCSIREKAFIAAKLIEMQFEEEDALLATRQCSDVYNAVEFLTQFCELCKCRFPIHQIASMVHCPHSACKQCMKAHFSTLIRDRSVFSLLCPFCHKPDISDLNMQEYFNHLDMMFRGFLDFETYDMFQKKLRDEVLTKDPNFHWCSQCSSGFIASPRLKKLYCPDCTAITCAMCHQTWEPEHEGVYCERFQQWKDMHTPEPPPAGIVKELAERGIECPSCGLHYGHASAGCMFYRCAHCNYEFCAFCRRPYKKGKDCKELESCEDLVAHAHHPYNCLFHLRDREPSDLQQLLEEHSVSYRIVPARDQIVKRRCQVREQKHSHGAVIEDRCGRDIAPYCAGICRLHYMEYLSELIKKHKLDIFPILTTFDIQYMLRKSRIPVPERVKGESPEEYRDRLSQVVTSTMA